MWSRLALRRWLVLGVVSATLLGLAGACVVIAAKTMSLPDGLFTEASAVVYYSDGSPAHIFLAEDDALRVAVADLHQVDPKYLEALLAFEDRRFYRHGGVDLWAILRAAATNLSRGRVVSGGSTLTMQLARMREPRPRTLWAKLQEAFRALQIEATLSKEEILKAYLTYAPYGGNREGIEVAARAFFGHGPQHLSPGEIGVLLAIPQRPAPRMPSAANRQRLRGARDHVLSTLVRAGVFPEDGVFGEEVPDRVLARPREVPHLAYWLVGRWPARRAFHTTLDKWAQASVEAVLAGARADLEHKGIHNGAVVVADHREGEIRALSGSLQFWTDQHGGQIPGFEVRRSPGSALKPFIYGRALEEGMILPETLLPDVPRDYAGYQPENYDGKFDGAVPAREALARSLNLPFVELLKSIGVERFMGELVTLGAASLDGAPGRFGLSAAIGAVELTPLELAQLYAGIASDGKVRRLKILKSDPHPLAQRMWSPAAAALVRDALDDRDRPDFPARSRLRGVPPGIHWKTGTSYAHRDAWSAGSDARHTVVVWLGNFDRRPAPNLVGAEAAGPVFFDIIEGLPNAKPARRESHPGLSEIEVCALSGRPAHSFCPHKKKVRALTHRVPTEACRLHVLRWIAPDSGLSVRPNCSEVLAPERRVFESWPADVLRHLGPAGRQGPAPPPPDPRCGSVVGMASRPPKILSPARGTRLLVPGLTPEEQEVPLEGMADGGRLRWFLDGVFLGTTERGERLWWSPTVGTHELVAQDDAARRARRTLIVVNGNLSGEDNP